MNLVAVFAQTSLFVDHESPFFLILKLVGYTVVYGGLALAIFSAFKKTPKPSLDKTPSGPTSTTPFPIPPTTSEAKPTIEERLRTLLQLKEAGLITAEECEARTQKILETI